MKIETTEDMVKKADRAHAQAMWRGEDKMRAALEAVAPIIADQVLERAAQVMDERSKLRSDDDYSIGHSDGSRSGAHAIRALKEPAQ